MSVLERAEHLRPFDDADAVHLVEQVNKLARIKRELHQQLGREATDDELANESGIPAEKIADLLDHSRDPVSLDMPVGSDEEAPLGDFIEDAEATSAENAVIAGLLHPDIRADLATLDEREQQVIRLRFGLDDGQPRTLDQIGRMFGLSRERVRQIEREVMGKLRQGERAERLRAAIIGAIMTAGIDLQQFAADSIAAGHATLATVPRCPPSTWICVFVRMSHTRADASRPAVTSTSSVGCRLSA